MRCLRFSFNILAASLLALSFSASGTAQSRMWVSSAGSDANPCSRTMPCATFNGALSRIPLGGEINCADSGEFGAVFITQPVTIDCVGNLGSISSAGATAINIQAAGADVTIRNLTINGGGGSGPGIYYQSAKSVNIENVQISGYDGTTSSSCIQAYTSGTTGSFSGDLKVANSSLSKCGIGISVGTTGTTGVYADIHSTRIWNTTTGIALGDGSHALIHNCNIYSNTNGIWAVGVTTSSKASVVGNTLGRSSQAGLLADSNSLILASGNTFVNAISAFMEVSGGAILTAGENNWAFGGVGTNSGTLPKI
jgi:hypothetical protein